MGVIHLALHGSISRDCDKTCYIWYWKQLITFQVTECDDNKFCNIPPYLVVNHNHGDFLRDMPLTHQSFGDWRWCQHDISNPNPHLNESLSKQHGIWPATHRNGPMQRQSAINFWTQHDATTKHETNSPTNTGIQYQPMCINAWQVATPCEMLSWSKTLQCAKGQNYCYPSMFAMLGPRQGFWWLNLTTSKYLLMNMAKKIPNCFL